MTVDLLQLQYCSIDEHIHRNPISARRQKTVPQDLINLQLFGPWISNVDGPRLNGTKCRTEGSARPVQQ